MAKHKGQGDIAIGPRTKAKLAVALANSKKAEDIVVLDVRKVTNFCDYFFICSGNTERQVAAIAQGIEEGFLEKKIKAITPRQGRDSTWALLDYGDLIIHVFQKEAREYYKLERLWVDAPRLSFPTN